MESSEGIIKGTHSRPRLRPKPGMPVSTFGASLPATALDWALLELIRFTASISGNAEVEESIRHCIRLHVG